jgi:hypothetical protein
MGSSCRRRVCRELWRPAKATTTGTERERMTTKRMTTGTETEITGERWRSREMESEKERGGRGGGEWGSRKNKFSRAWRSQCWQSTCNEETWW